MIDNDLVTRKMVLIAQDLRELEHIGRGGLDTFLGDRHAVVLAERYLERAIGRMIDINFHVLIESGQPPPSDYYASFLALGPLGVYDASFARGIAAAAGLRNRIAQEYDEIDARLLFEALVAATADVPAYLAHLRRHLDLDH